MNTSDEPSAAPFFFVAGPTASGKSWLAAHIAQAIGGVVVGCDASQLYRGLPILTAQPEPELMALAEHRLVGVVTPEQEISAGWYQRQASETLAALWAAGKPPVVCGGSGLYLRALTHGLDDLPPTPAAIRERYQALTPREALHLLLHREPGAAQWVALDNPRRVQRALELLTTTGRSLAELRARQDRPQYPGISGISLTWDRAELRERISRRTERMLSGGAIEEVAALGEGNTSQSFQNVIGLREIRHLLRGNISREKCFQEVFLATAQYAKRQGTWFRRQPMGHQLTLSGEKAEFKNELAHAVGFAETWLEVASP